MSSVLENGSINVTKAVDSYLNDEDWRTRENSNIGKTFQGLMLYMSSTLQAKYVLEKFPEKIKEAHMNGYIHIHDLGFGLAGYCSGWSLYDLLLEGFNCPGYCCSAPPKHFEAALGQMVNFLGTLQNEFAGAQAFNNVDTYLAPFVAYDSLNYTEVKQSMQKFIYNLNTTSRWGGQSIPVKDSRYLCEDGFKSYDELEEDDLIYTWKNGQLELQPIGALNVYDYEGEIHHYEGRNVEIDVTPNHNMIYRTEPNNFRKAPSYDTIDLKSPIIFPVAGENNLPDYPIPDNLLEFLVFILTDGCIEVRYNRPNNRLQWYKTENRYGIKRFETLCNNLGLEYTIHDCYSPDFDSHCSSFTIVKGTANVILELLQDTKKEIPSFFRYLSQRQARLVIDTWSRLDGYQESNTCFKCQVDNDIIGDQLQHVAILAGYSTRVLERLIRPNKTPTKYVYAYTAKERTVTSKSKFYYKGKVFCPTTENGVIVCKYKGKSVITGNSPFTNLSFDLSCPNHLKEASVIIGGRVMDKVYGDFHIEREMINRAFLELMSEGDYDGRIFTFPIPTYNIGGDFPWDTEVGHLLLKVAAKYGVPYFQNFINSDLKPEDVRSMCCRLQIDLKELRRKTGGLFGSGDLTGSIGVVTLNLPRLAYLSTDKNQFQYFIAHYTNLASEALEIKRSWLKEGLDKGLFPFSNRYLKNGFNGHFSTIGVIGGNEACQNLLGKNFDIMCASGRELIHDTLIQLRDLLSHYQDTTGHIYNLEATPAEGACYRLAKLDKEEFPDIITAGEDEPYYTNSTQLPVDATDNVFDAIGHQNNFQPLYTGGTVFHTFLGEAVADPMSVKSLLLKIMRNTKLPYVSISPTFSICPEHGYLNGEQAECPYCGKETEIYSRVVGYYRPVKAWHLGKKEEFRQRKTFKI